MKHALTVAVMMCCAGAAAGGIADFYVAGANGSIYSVDGSTLAASQVFSISGGMAINDIIFVGGNKMLANVTDSLIQYDMTTGVETVIFNTDDYEGVDEFYFSSGFAGTSDGDIFMSIREIGPDRNDLLGATYDPFTGTFTELANIDVDLGLFFDHQQIGDHEFLGADFENQRIVSFDSLTGEQLASYSLSFGPVSFLELGAQLYALDKDGGLYTFDAGTGQAQFYGDITGFSGDLLGAASTQVFRIPAPAGTAVFAVFGLITTKRRR